MKRIIYAISALILGSALIFTSCKKSDPQPTTQTDVSDADVDNESLAVDDNSSIDATLDDATLDAVGVAQSSEGRLEFNYSCDVTAVTMTTIAGIRTIVYTYDGSACKEGVKRAGTVTVKLIKGLYFSEKDAVYQITFQGVGVVRNNKNTTLNGTHTVVNLTGGIPTYSELIGGEDNTIKYKVRGNMVITYPSNKTLSWQVAKIITFTSNNGLFLSVSGDTTIDGKTGVIYWGRDRFDRDFVISISESLTFSSTCGWYHPIAGVRFSYVDKNGGDLFIKEELSFEKGSNGCGSAYRISVTKKNHTKVKTYLY